jgi:membrane-associated phospholipid phosphatase
VNQAAFLWINQQASILPDWLWSVLTITGNACVTAALFAWFLPRHRHIITALLFAMLMAGPVNAILKIAFDVDRPAMVLAADQFHLIGYRLLRSSFPSGHSLTAFACAVMVICGLRLRMWPSLGLLLAAAMLSVSRIAVGAHWPADVLAGALLGVAFGYAAIRAALHAHQRFPLFESIGYQWFLSVFVFALSASLFATRMGYRLALPWQMAAALMGVILSVRFADRHLVKARGLTWPFVARYLRNAVAFGPAAEVI